MPPYQAISDIALVSGRLAKEALFAAWLDLLAACGWKMP